MSAGNQIWLDIYMGLVSVLVPIVATYAVNFLRAKIGNENLGKYATMAEQAVRAVEQVIGSGQGAVKKEAVEKYLSEKLGNKLTASEIDMLIESTVHTVTQSIKQ
jgi:LL-H family phage holin